MIDEQWFATIRCLTGTNISDDAAERLRSTLGVEDEVLAYLLLRTDAFADWPNARHAFRRAVRSVIRPLPVSGRPATTAGNLALRSETAASTIASMTSGLPNEPRAERLGQLRLSNSGKDEDPNIFINSAQRDQA